MEESSGVQEVVGHLEKKIPQDQKDVFLAELAGKGAATSAFAWAFADGVPPTLGFRHFANLDGVNVFFESLPDSIGAEKLNLDRAKPLKATERREIANQIFQTFDGEIRGVLNFQEDFLRQVFENDPQLNLVKDFFQWSLWLTEAVNGAKQKPISWQKAQVRAEEEMVKIYGPEWSRDPRMSLQRQREKTRRVFQHELTTKPQPDLLSEQEEYLYASLKGCCETLISKMIMEEMVGSFPTGEEALSRKPFPDEVSAGMPENEPVPISKEEFKKLKIKPVASQGQFSPEFITPEGDQVYFLLSQDSQGNYLFSNSGFRDTFRLTVSHGERFDLANARNYCRKKMVINAFENLVGFYYQVKERQSLDKVINVAGDLLARGGKIFFLDWIRDGDIFPLSSPTSLPKNLRDFDRMAVWKIIADAENHGTGYLAEKTLSAQKLGRPKPEVLWSGKEEEREKKETELNLDFKPKMENVPEAEYRERERMFNFALRGKQEDLAEISDLVVSSDLPGNVKRFSKYDLPSNSEGTVFLESVKQLAASRNGFLNLPAPLGFDLAGLKITADGRELPLSGIKIYHDSASGQYRIKLPGWAKGTPLSIKAGFRSSGNSSGEEERDLAVPDSRVSELAELLESRGLAAMAAAIRGKIGGEGRSTVLDLSEAIKSASEYSFDGKTAQGGDVFQRMASFYDPGSGKYRVQCGSQALFLSACLKFIFRGKRVVVGTESLYSLERSRILLYQKGESMVPVTASGVHARTVLFVGGEIYRYDATPALPVSVADTFMPGESRVLELGSSKQTEPDFDLIREYPGETFEPLIGELESLAERYYLRQEPTNKLDPDLRLYRLAERLSQSNQPGELKKALEEVGQIEELAEALLEKHRTGEISKTNLPPRFKKPTFALQFYTLVKSVEGRIFAAAS
ncbi:MAG: hypothetical protein ABH867_00880 [Patescibacteria group bacterium]|nr:hypothetical protein [Patescibacteria group bacterium]